MSTAESFRLEHLHFTYPGQQDAALKDLNLVIEQGQFVILCGPSGCGKTTLLRQLKTVLAPHGTRSGTIFFEGTPLDEWSQRAQSEKIGFVLQSPKRQLVTDKVWHELAFGLEGLGCESDTIRLRVAEMASFFGIQTWFYQNVTELSGGQKQLLNLAAVMAMQPSMLVLDEPTSQLDPIAAADFLATVRKINRELGVTVLLTEHRLEDALPLADRCIVMDGGRVVADGAPEAVGETLRARGHAMFLSMPTPMQIWAGVENRQACPITVRDGRNWLTEQNRAHPMNCRPAPLAQRPKKPPIIELEQVWFRYEKELPDVVKGLTLSVPAGEFCALVGGNGTGKTTTLSLISGIRTPNRGAVKLDGRPLADIPDGEKFSGLLGVLPQNPQALFVKKTLELDLYEMLSDRKITKAEKAKKVGAVAALAKVLLLEPRVLLLDEPTKGMDSNFKEKFAQILQSLQAEGATIVMVSHDIEFCARYADRCALFFDGSIVTSGEPRSFFSGNSFYTTAANRMARHLLPGAVTAEDVIAACGGSAAVREGLPATETASAAPQKKPAIPEKPAASWKKPAAALLLSLAAVMILLLIPLTIFIGFYYLDNRKYYFISMLVILETLVPFFMVFERRKPQTRELVVLVVLCAIGVAGLAAFFALPQFKPVAALVILTAVAFGGESGFVVGTLTMFLSNLFYSQGPWTLWQMFAMGIVGFLAGVLFKKGVLRRSRVELCVFGFLATFFVYGAIMNASMVFTYQEKPTLAMLATYCLLGIPFDLIHATATAFFLWVEGPAMLEKLDRIKRKYGLIGS